MKQAHFTAYTVRTNSETEIWTRIGAAFLNKNGGFTVLLDAMPPAAKGRYRIVVLPPKPVVEIEAEASSDEEETAE